GGYLMWEARLAQFLATIGDSAKSSIALSQGQVIYTNQVRSDLCVQTPSGNSPAGCTIDYVNNPNTVPFNRGTSKLRGFNHPWKEWIDQTGCSSPGGLRDASTFQHGILAQGLWEIHQAEGPGWQYYNESLDTAYGISQWAFGEMY